MEKMVVTSKRVRDIEFQIAEIDDLISKETRYTRSTTLDQILNHRKISWLGAYNSSARVANAQNTIRHLEYRKTLLLMMRATAVREEYERYKKLLAQNQADLRASGPGPLGDPKDKTPSATSPTLAPEPTTTIIIPVSQKE